MQEAANYGHQGIVGFMQYLMLEEKTGIHYTKEI